MLFQSLNKTQKIEFFLNSQRILTEFHPKSSFIIRVNNMKERLDHAKYLSENYKGFCYSDENVAILYNKIFFDASDLIGSFKGGQFKEASENYNSIIIDWAAFRKMEDCFKFIQLNNDSKLAHTIYVKNGKPQVYKTEQLVARLMRIPLAKK